MRRFAGLLAMLLLVAGQGARADWSGFYTPTERPADEMRGHRNTGAPDGVCIQEILRAQLRYQIPGNMLLAIGLQEAGMMREGELTIWPWVANAEGEGRFFATQTEAEDWVKDRIRSGQKSIDLGCMQVNIHWHPDAFDTLRDGFNAARNVDYAARLLVSLHKETGDWITAAGRYHSATQEYQQVYLDRLQVNANIANTRIDTFRMLAAQGGTYVAGAEPRAPLPEGHFWTSWLTQDRADAGQGTRSLYAREALEPILPNFMKTF